MTVPKTVHEHVVEERAIVIQERVPLLPKERILPIAKKYSVAEGTVCAKVLLETLEGLDRVKEDVAVTHPELSDKMIHSLAKARLRHLRIKERVRICNKLDIYQGARLDLQECDRLIQYVWVNYEKEFDRGTNIERMRKDLDDTGYSHRAVVLATLGFPSYQEYLNSELWREIRLKVLDRDKHTCKICQDSKATQVHHRLYDEATLRGSDLRTLISLCGECHLTLEFTPEGKKRSFSEVASLCRKLVTANNNRTAYLSENQLKTLYPSLSQRRILELSKMTRAKQVQKLRTLRKNRRKKQNKRKSFFQKDDV